MKVNTASRELGVRQEVDNNREANAQIGHCVWLQLRVP